MSLERNDSPCGSVITGSFMVGRKFSRVVVVIGADG